MCDSVIREGVIDRIRFWRPITCISKVGNTKTSSQKKAAPNGVASFLSSQGDLLRLVAYPQVANSAGQVMCDDAHADDTTREADRWVLVENVVEPERYQHVVIEE